MPLQKAKVKDQLSLFELVDAASNPHPHQNAGIFFNIRAFLAFQLSTSFAALTMASVVCEQSKLESLRSFCLSYWLTLFIAGNSFWFAFAAECNANSLDQHYYGWPASTKVKSCLHGAL